VNLIKLYRGRFIFKKAEAAGCTPDVTRMKHLICKVFHFTEKKRREINQCILVIS